MIPQTFRQPEPWRAAAALAAAAASLLFVRCAPQVSNRKGVDSPVARQTQWLELESASSDASTRLRVATREAIENLDPSVDAPEKLADLASLILSALISGDGREYFRFMERSRARLDRAMAESLATDWNGWGFIDLDSFTSLSDEELFSTLWASASSRGMVLDAVDVHGIRVGRGLSRTQMNTSEWSYTGLRSQLSLLVRPEGRLSQVEAAQLPVGRAGFVRFRVRFGDSANGDILVHFMYEEQTGHWWPLSISVGSGSTGQWPFPLVWVRDATSGSSRTSRCRRRTRRRR